MHKKFTKLILIYCSLCFIGLWINHIQNNCAYIFNQYKLQNIICGVIHNVSNNNFGELAYSKNLPSDLTFNLKSSLQKSLDKIHASKFNLTDKACFFCIHSLNLPKYDLVEFSLLNFKLNNFSHL